MPRTLWKGSLSFGLVTIPVQLFTATEDRSPSFNQLRTGDHSRISYKRVAKADGAEVDYDDIVKGYEYARDHYVVFSKEELEALRPPSSRVIEIEQFVPRAQIDPLYFNRSYYLAPEPSGAKAYGLLSSAMSDEDTVAICRITMRDKEHLAALRLVKAVPGHTGDGKGRDDSPGVFVLETMHWPDEIRPPEFEELDKTVKVRDAELKMARQLVQQLSDEFRPEEFEDDYRKAVEALIEKKVEGEEITVAPPPSEEPAKVVDLMEALRASVDEAKKKKSKAEDGEAKKKPTARKKASAS